MADIQMSGPSMGYGGASAGNSSNTGPASGLKSGVSVTALTNAAGAVVSLALIVGIGIWGYKLLVRDVTGIPVVRAAEGPMRVAPENPGGQQADHQGLAVNEVAGRGTASGPVDQVALAPSSVGLEEEDLPLQALMPFADTTKGEAELVAPVPAEQQPVQAALPTDTEPREPVRQIMTNRVTGAPQAERGAETAPIQNATIQALADQIAAGSARLSDAAPTPTPPVKTEVKPVETAAVSPVIDAPGVRRSLRPKTRPSTLRETAVLATVQAAIPSPASALDVDPASLASGTRLVQLGAYDSAEVAQQEWTRISGKFDTFFEEKKRVIQKAQSGGRTFYRLRAHGFTDLSDARRFCAALVAERADCIPVVVK